VKPTEKKDAVLRLRMPCHCYECLLQDEDLCLVTYVRPTEDDSPIPRSFTDEERYSGVRPEWCPLEEVAWAPPVPTTSFEAFRAGLTVEGILRYFRGCGNCPARRHCADVVNSGVETWEGCEKVIRAWADLPAEGEEG